MGQAIVMDVLAAAAAAPTIEFYSGPSFYEHLIAELQSPDTLWLSVFGILLTAATLCGLGRKRFILGALAWAVPLMGAIGSVGISPSLVVDCHPVNRQSDPVGAD